MLTKGVVYRIFEEKKGVKDEDLKSQQLLLSGYFSGDNRPY
jgi:hypothetical protein